MKKRILLFIMLIAAVTVNAQVFVEYFETATVGGDVEGYNDWYVSFKSSEANGVSPKIEELPLFYEGYKGSDIGHVAVLDSLVGQASATQRISTKVVSFGTDTLTPVVGQKMYAAFLVSILPDSYNSFRDFFTWEASTGSSFTRGRVFVKVEDNNTDMTLAVSKNSSGELAESALMEGAVEGIHLLVLVYEVIEGDANDVIKLYINPDLSKPEGEQTNVLVNTDTQSDYTAGSSKIKINLRQRGIGAYVGGIRVGTDWNEVLLGGSTKISEIGTSTKSSIYSTRNTIVTSGPGTVNVYDITGRQVMSKTTSGRMQTSLKSGIYLVRFEDINGKLVSGKVVLNEQ
jgi:hypothetical protein